MKTQFNYFLKLSLMATVLAGLVFVTACNDDDEPTVDPLVGNYKLNAATYLGLYNPADGSTAAVTMNIVPIGDIPVNAPISSLVEGVLNGVSECVASDGVTPDPTQVQIEFRADGTLWFTCDGVGDTQSGTWTKVDATTVTLNISPTDNIPTGLSLTMSNFVVAGSNLSGRIDGFPMPKDLTLPLGSPLPDDGGPNIQLLSLTMVLVKKTTK